MRANTHRHVLPPHCQSGAILLAVVGLLVGLMSTALWVSYSAMLNEMKIQQHEITLEHTKIAMQNEMNMLTEKLRIANNWEHVSSENSAISAYPFLGKDNYPITLFSITVTHETHSLFIRQQFVRYSSLFRLPTSGALIEHNPMMLATLFNQQQPSFSPLNFISPVVIANCSVVPPSNIIWVNGNCEVSADITLGSDASPVLLIIRNGSFTVKSGAVVRGLVVMFEEHASNTAIAISPRKVNIHANAALHGAVVSETAIQASLLGDVAFDSTLLATLQRSGSLHKMHPVPGSWNDFD